MIPDWMREEPEYDQFIDHNCAGECKCEDCKRYREKVACQKNDNSR